MSVIILNQPETVARFVSSRIPGFLFNWQKNDFTAIGFASPDGALKAGLVFHNFRTIDVEVSLAANGVWPVKQLLVFAADLAFNRWGCVRITALISQKNKRARKFAKHVGFKEEGTLEAGYDGKVNAIIYGMTKRNCRWLKGG